MMVPARLPVGICWLWKTRGDGCGVIDGGGVRVGVVVGLSGTV